MHLILMLQHEWLRNIYQGSHIMVRGGRPHKLFLAISHFNATGDQLAHHIRSHFNQLGELFFISSARWFLFPPGSAVYSKQHPLLWFQKNYDSLAVKVGNS